MTQNQDEELEFIRALLGKPPVDEAGTKPPDLMAGNRVAAEGGNPTPSPPCTA